MSRMFRWAARPLRPVAVVLPVLAPAAAAHAQTDAACAAGPRRTAHLSRIDARLEFVLDDGTHLRLFGIEAPASRSPPDPSAEARRAQLARWLGKADLAIVPASPAPDRWGRLTARVFAPSSGAAGAPPLPVAETMVDAGFARVRPEAAPAACMAGLFKAEAAARAHNLGLWADPANAVLPASDPDALARRAGETLIVEGRVTSVGETRTRLYLNFGPRRGRDFSASIARRRLRAFEAAGLAPKGLAGRVLRVRGLLEMRSGPQIDIELPAAVEIVTVASVSPQSGPVARR
jgi:endonuclease YncB( thermonuclease family)